MVTRVPWPSKCANYLNFFYRFEIQSEMHHPAIADHIYTLSVYINFKINEPKGDACLYY